MENFEIDREKNSVLVSINPKIYPLEVIYSAAYIFTENCYVLLDGNPEDEIIVELKPKNESENLEKIAMEFNNELVNYGSYSFQLAKNSHLRSILLHRILQTAGSQQHHHESATEAANPDMTSKPWKEENEQSVN